MPNYVNFKIDSALLLPECKGHRLYCANELEHNFGNEEKNLTYALNSDNELKKCYQRCYTQEQTSTSTITTFPNSQTFKYRPEYW